MRRIMVILYFILSTPNDRYCYVWLFVSQSRQSFPSTLCNSDKAIVWDVTCEYQCRVDYRTMSLSIGSSSAVVVPGCVEWSKTDTVRIIDNVKIHPSIWQVRNKNYKHRDMRVAAYSTILMNLIECIPNITVDYFKNETNALITQKHFWFSQMWQHVTICTFHNFGGMSSYNNFSVKYC